MRDVFYTILVIWIVYKIWNSFSRPAPKTTSQHFDQRKQGDIRVDDTKSQSTGKNNNSGDYVDFEEIKD